MQRFFSFFSQKRLGMSVQTLKAHAKKKEKINYANVKNLLLMLFRMCKVLMIVICTNRQHCFFFVLFCFIVHWYATVPEKSIPWITNKTEIPQQFSRLTRGKDISTLVCVI